jgi:hypothetical protein
MSTATMTQAQGLRQQIAETFGKIRAFAIEMYQAHGGWFALARRAHLKLVINAEQSK